ncbi:hypothetical protein DFH06DRAFT_1129007 [Mycena polygramma]|nr:hypothetical protein DFH06DRAFT_1129007 [Mycena polygramma]
MFCEIPVQPGTLTLCGDALSITVADLILSLRRLQLDPSNDETENTTIQDLIMGRLSTFMSISLSTVRVPDFTCLSGHAGAAVAHRSLISLARAEQEVRTGASLSLSSRYKIIAAVESLNNTSATELLRLWAPLGVAARSLFILIATIPEVWEHISLFPTDSLDTPSICSSQETQLSSVDSTLLPEPSPSGVYDSSPSGISSLPQSGLEPEWFGIQTRDLSGPHRSKQTNDSAPGALPSEIHKVVQELAQTLDPADTFSTAQYSTKSTLTEMIRQYEWPWSPQTFRNKSPIYVDGKQAALSSWIGAPPVASGDLALYRMWQGAAFLWSAMGPVCTGVEPDGNSNDETVREASKLTQNGLAKIKTRAFVKKNLKSVAN